MRIRAWVIGGVLIIGGLATDVAFEIIGGLATAVAFEAGVVPHTERSETGLLFGTVEFLLYVIGFWLSAISISWANGRRRIVGWTLWTVLVLFVAIVVLRRLLP